MFLWGERDVALWIGLLGWKVLDLLCGITARARALAARKDGWGWPREPAGKRMSETQQGTAAGTSLLNKQRHGRWKQGGGLSCPTPPSPPTTLALGTSNLPTFQPPRASKKPICPEMGTKCHQTVSHMCPLPVGEWGLMPAPAAGHYAMPLIND